jgi:DNA-binding transcriptional regulator LsrR (DeoR family)
MKYYMDSDIRKALTDAIRVGNWTQADIARECKVSPQNVSAMVKGAPINGKVLMWLGFRRVDGLYERVKP